MSISQLAFRASHLTASPFKVAKELCEIFFVCFLVGIDINGCNHSVRVLVGNFSQSWVVHPSPLVIETKSDAMLFSRRESAQALLTSRPTK